MQTKILKSILILGSGLLLAACGASQKVETTATIDYSYEAKHPITDEVITSGTLLAQTYAPSNSQIFELLSGAKVGEMRKLSLKDPFLQHNPQLMQKFPLLILQEMWIELDSTSDTLELDGKNYILWDFISENGVEKVILDENPLETVKELDWTFKVDAIK